MYKFMLIPLREYNGQRSFGQVSHHSTFEDAESSIEFAILHYGPNPDRRGWIIVDVYGIIYHYGHDGEQIRK